MQTRRLPRVAGSLITFCSLLPAFAQTAAPPPPPAANSPTNPVIQLPPDQTAYKAANAIIDNDRRAIALAAFLRDFPESKHADSARRKLFQLLLEHQPPDKHQIHQLAQSLIDHAEKNERPNTENFVAYELAEAPPNGIDLKAAEAWAKDAVAAVTLPAMTAVMKESSEKYKYPMLSAQEMQEYWASVRAGNLQTLADVYFHEGKLSKSSQALDQAAALDPTEGGIFVTRGQVAHARHNDAEALDNLELAEIYGGISASTRSLLLELYAARHNGDRSGLDAEIDGRYLSLRKTFTPARHTAPPLGRTVLLELFTGAACPPCVAADLGLDGVLQAYPRSEVVALSLDLHIPDPDPLTNPDTVARAEYDSIYGTPFFRVDGQPMEGAYGRRAEGEKAFKTISKAIDTDLGTPSGVTLELTANLTPAHTIVASANVQVTSPDALKKVLAATIETDKEGLAVAERKGINVKALPAPVASKLVLNFALVQKQVRYSGENGIRFHSMVVRSLAKPTADAFPVALAGPSTASFTFDPAVVSASLSRYLADFARHNERFGTAKFLVDKTDLPLDQLAVAAWIEDPTTHHVVAAAFVPLDPHTQEATR